MMMRLLPLLLLLLAACTPNTRLATSEPRPPLILISVDGLRADYLDRGITPNIAALAAGGARAAMRPSFPSLTFPNHYTLVTGLRPDRHGIVNNNMEDPALGKFALSNRDAVTDRRWWDAAEPIWVTAENAGIPTATMFWPGSEAAIHGVRPRQWLTFDAALPNPARVTQVLAWLGQLQRPGLVALYFDSVDHDGHAFGPDSPQVNTAIAEVDARIGDLVAGLRAKALAANIVLVADHGMAAVARERTVLLADLLPAGSYRLVAGGAVAAIVPADGQAAVVEAALRKPHDHMRCYRKGELPKALHYGANPRVPPLVCLAAPGWLIFADPAKPDAGPLAGMHGYDPALPDMAAAFVANGPAFRAGTRLRSFDNVDIYPLLMRLLDLKPLASDGTIAPLRPALAAVR
ncbi:phosphodiesterase [alpha proteobacterium AAP81b]|nr:phosphodiesterase [alpha proteobacterium AAP81b]